MIIKEKTFFHNENVNNCGHTTTITNNNSDNDNAFYIQLKHWYNLYSTFTRSRQSKKAKKMYTEANTMKQTVFKHNENSKKQQADITKMLVYKNK